MRTAADRLFPVLCWTAGLGIPAAAATLVAFVAWRGAAAAATSWGPQGLGAAVAGTLLLVFGSATIAVPLGIAAGVHLAESPPGRGRRLLRLAVELLASVPSILIGLLGFSAILVLRHTIAPDANVGLALAASCLALLMLPYVVVTTASSLEGLPQSLRLAGASLGLTRWQCTRRILLPAAGRGILGGVVLALGRGAEDTAVILLTGVVASAGLPDGVGARFEALPFKVYYLAAEHRTPADLDLAFGAALVLLFVTGTLCAAANVLQRSVERRWTGPT